MAIATTPRRRKHAKSPLGPGQTGPRYGPNHEPLGPREAARWARLEKDFYLIEQRDRMHTARMEVGLGLCGYCWGFVDDPRHVAIGPPIFGGVESSSRTR
jgi:hypothetical protein